MSQPLRIFVVEDSPTQALGVKRVLMQLPEVQVQLFSDGLEAYRAILQNVPDILLMDLILPSLHGFALCRLLKFHLDYQHIPILIFSSITEKDIAEQAADAGADLFLQKPFAPNDLILSVQALIDKRSPMAGVE